MKLAEANHAEATKNYEEYKAVRAKKMEAFRRAKDAYCESAEGIQALRDAGRDNDAEKYATIREMKMEELKRLEAIKVDMGKAAIQAVIEKPVAAEPMVTKPIEPSISPERYKELAQMVADDSPRYLGAYSAASELDCPAEILAKLANHEQENVRRQVAQRP